MPRRRQTKKGRVNPIDVRSKKDVGLFEGLLGKGPLTIVLVYADWCGHCQTFKQNMWNQVSAMPNKNLNTASVHYDMVDKTTLKNAKIDGYPSLLLVGTDKKPATFKENGTVTNAMPPPQSIEELTNMVNTPVKSPVFNANAVATNVVNSAKSPVNTGANGVNTIDTVTNEGMSLNENTGTNTNTNTNTVTNRSNNIFSQAKNVNTYEPEDANLLSVPDTTADMARGSVLARTEIRNQNKVGGGQRGGSETLLTALTRITMEAGHAGALLLAATEYADVGKRLTRRLKKRSKKTAKRKQRR
jgi:thiol-disulfide isomerase/thioredoxin